MKKVSLYCLYLLLWTVTICFLGCCGRHSETDERCIDPSFIYRPLTQGVTKCCRTPKYIVIHYTAGRRSSPGKAQNLYNAFMSQKASADFAVDDRDIVQFNPDICNYYSWAVGDNKKKNSKGGRFKGKVNNKNSISIEICSTCVSFPLDAKNYANHNGWKFTDKTIKNAIKLTRMLMEKYDIPIERVVRHYDVTGKMCPGIIGWNDEPIYNRKGKKTAKRNSSDTWKEFKKKISIPL